MLKPMYESSFSPAVWVLGEDSICTVSKKDTKTPKLMIPLHVAPVGKAGKRDLISWICSHGKCKNHFLHSFYHFVFLHREILKRTGVFMIIIIIIELFLNP